MKLKTKLEFSCDFYDGVPLIDYVVDLAEDFGLTFAGSSWGKFVEIIILSGKKNQLNRFVREMIGRGFHLLNRNPAGGSWR